MKKLNRIKKICSMFLVFLLVFGTGGATLAENGADELVSELHIEIAAPLCGQDVSGASPQTGAPRVYLEETYAAQSDEPCAWVVSCDENDPFSFVPFQGKIEGEKDYQALVGIKAVPGYAFDDDLQVLLFNPSTRGYEYCELIRKDRERIIFSVSCRAMHDWDGNRFVHTDSTCVTGGSNLYVCGADPSHTHTDRLPVDPNAHSWGEWTVSKNPTATEEGIRERRCVLCGMVETEVIPMLTLPYTKVYEPVTSWPMAATVAWRTDSHALETAVKDVRPATAFVWLDRDLRVYDRNGVLLSNDINSYIAATSAGMIPAFYIRDGETASALKAWLQTSGLLDCFVVSTPDNRDLVKDVADLLHVRGMLDFTIVRNPNSRAISNMIACVNSSHGKVVLLSPEAASYETVRKMQSLTAAVWVQTPSDTKSLMTLYTSGVNGVVTDDYEAAIRAEEFFQDDAPSLLRVPYIIGHRGDPSIFPENTLESALGAYDEGVDAVENDIQLSADGELFIFHDETADRFLGIWGSGGAGSRIPAESLSLAALQSRSFRWSDILQYNEVSAASSRWGMFYGQREQKDYRIPSLKEYIEAFKNTDIVHDTEIKSENLKIIPVFKELVDAYDAWDQFFTITMNISILDEIYKNYPEISVGALGMRSTTEVIYKDYDAIAREAGPETALRSLYEIIDQWNATYNPGYGRYGEQMMRAGRHRGLTVWPWTYLPDADFAHDYLSGVTGMTLDHPWIVSDYLEKILSEDVTAASTAEIPKPKGITKNGSECVLENAEPVGIEKLSDSETLMIWRYKADLIAAGVNYGKYYLYSQPFVFTKESSGVENALPFIDVPETAYYAEPVKWAYSSGVTSGVNDFSFAPGATCTRAQVLTFLWRMMGEPEPRTTDNPFEDISENDYFCKAVLWGVENGITDGVDDRHFGPQKACTRAQSAVFLWRLHGSEEPERTGGIFDDVPSDSYYSSAVSWAVEHGITKGTSDTAFSPGDACKRAQIVSFLYRDGAEKRSEGSSRTLSGM